MISSICIKTNNKCYCLFYHKIAKVTKKKKLSRKQNDLCKSCLANGGDKREILEKRKKTRYRYAAKKKSVLPQAFGFLENICHTAVPF